MKIRSIKLSNILSFKYVADISDASGVDFNSSLNIIIGENGSGKSTLLEVINFIFRKVLFGQTIFNRSCLFEPQNYQSTLTYITDNHFSGFRLDPNWHTPDQPQQIRITVEIDDADIGNIEKINTDKVHIEKIRLAYSYSSLNLPIAKPQNNILTVLVTLDNTSKTYSVAYSPDDTGIREYLEKYNFIDNLIELHNETCTDGHLIAPLNESFAMLSAFRNYGAFNKAISLQNDTLNNQLRSAHDQDSSRSVNSTSDQEPIIFGYVRLLVAGEHFNLTQTMPVDETCITKANQTECIRMINEKLAMINLNCQLRLIEKRTWSYEFVFKDIRYNQELGDINSLSAGQKSIVHLIFEAYGRRNLRGGVMIIDEPEVHLHYQLQHEYLHIIEELAPSSKMQYILVTHSDELVNSKTIEYVKRIALDEERHSIAYSPTIKTEDKWLVKVLDNSRSTYALFGRAVILVEGECDEYFFKAVLNELHPSLSRNIAVFNAGGKKSIPKWKHFFKGMGIQVHEIYDLDKAFDTIYKDEKPIKLGPDGEQENLPCFIRNHPTLHEDLQDLYKNRMYILEGGTLEHYIDLKKKATLDDLIMFCSRTDKLKKLLDGSTEESQEITNIMNRISDNLT